MFLSVYLGSNLQIIEGWGGKGGGGVTHSTMVIIDRNVLGEPV